MKRGLLVVFLGILATTDASAQVARTVDSTRIRVIDVMPDAPVAVSDIDIGPAPSPGASRLLGQPEIEGAILRAGQSLKGLRIPKSVRVTVPSRRITAVELASLAEPSIRKQLPDGVTLKRATAMGAMVTPRRVAVGAITIPRHPRQKGEFRTTAMMELSNDGVVFSRVPIAVVLDVSEAAARPDVTRGGAVTLVVSQRSFEIRAQAIAQAEASIGDTISVKVKSTGRVVRARVTAKDEAILTEGM